MSPTLLPDRFKNSHDYAISLHDEIVELVKAGGEAGIWGRVELQLRPEDQAADLAPLEGDALWDWLEHHGYRGTVNEMAMRGTVGAVAADFCNFVLEALRCSEKEKLTVCYALLRKPFRENLYILERILVDDVGFLKAFHETAAEPLSVGTAFRDGSLRRIVEAAASLTETTSVVPASYLFELRYDRVVPHGFEPLWNKALHLVTTKNFCRTTPQNLNFVFSDASALMSQWEHLYQNAPFLINYARELVELLLEKLGGSLPRVDERLLTRTAGAALSAVDWQLESPEFSLPCVRCKDFYLLSPEDYARLFYEHEFRCPNCGSRWNRQQVVDPLRTMEEQSRVRGAWEFLRGIIWRWTHQSTYQSRRRDNHRFEEP